MNDSTHNLSRDKENKCSYCGQLSRKISARFCWNCGHRFPLDEEAFHLKELRRIYLRRLQVLEKQAAIYGMATAPVHLILEIEELNEKIEIFTRQISLLEMREKEKLSNSIIEFHFTTSTNNPSIREIKVLEVALATGVLTEEVQLITSSDNTFVLRIQAPESIIKQIIARYSNGDPLITSLNIDYIVSIDALDVSNDIDRFISQCRCSIKKKIFNIYFFKSPSNRWLAGQVESFEIPNESVSQKIAIRGTIDTDINYSGCPYCNSRGIFKHVECGRISCWIPQTTIALCAWCDETFSVTSSITNLDGHVDL